MASARFFTASLLLLQLCSSIHAGSKVSHSDCDVAEAHERMDCGYVGIEQPECSSRGCCWQPSERPGVNWCYHAKSRMTAKCTALNYKNDCGYYGITSELCELNDCCWMPSGNGDVPWCFYGNETAAPGRTCGLPASTPQLGVRIVGGEDAAPHTWPWQASLTGSSGHFCGGSLISDRWIISAAHCDPGSPDALVILLGAHNKDVAEDTQVRAQVKALYPHPDYDSSTIDNDFMLIELEEAVTFTDAISPICLPEAGDQLPAGLTIQTTGWGTLELYGEIPSILQQLNLPVVDNDVCNEQDFYVGKITDNMICAGYMTAGQASCHGDSGGPLVAKVDGHWTVYGAVSWGYPCARENHPTLYTKVINYLEWSEEIMSQI